MKILIDPDYFFLRDMYYPSYLHVLHTVNLLERFGGTKLLNNFRVVISETTYYQLDEKALSRINPIVIFDKELRDIFDNQFISHNEAVQKLYSGDLTEKFLQDLKELYRQKLKGFEPDIVMQFEYHNKSYDTIFPNALNLTFQGGLFKRGLGPETYFIDPLGSLKDSSLNIFSDEINNFVITKEQNDIIYNFKLLINRLIKENTSYVGATLAPYREKFDYLVLLPLQISNHYGFDTEIGFKTQYDFLEYVLDNVPENVGVIVTEHDHEHFLNEGTFEKGGFLKWFQKKYKNLLYIKELLGCGGYSSPSIYFLPEVDAVINVSSSVALMATLFDKKIISAGKTYNNCFKDTQGLDNIVEVLNRPMKNKNSFLYWFLTHYVFLEKQLKDKDFMYQYLCRSLEKYKNDGIKFTYFEKMNEIDEVCNSIIKAIDDAFVKERECQITQQKELERARFLEEEHQKKLALKRKKCSIFGICYENKHIIIGFLGLKFKFKNILEE